MPLLFIPWAASSVQAALLQHLTLVPESAILEVVAMGNQTCQAEKLFEAPSRKKQKDDVLVKDGAELLIW